jgi:hypothetical protein
MEHKWSVSATLAKEKGIESEVVDAWMKLTKASPQIVPTILEQWYNGEINLLVPIEIKEQYVG